jgi:hypothetical protein
MNDRRCAYPQNMPQKLRVLVLEDWATDQELTLRELRQEGSDFAAKVRLSG